MAIRTDGTRIAIPTNVSISRANISVTDWMYLTFDNNNNNPTYIRPNVLIGCYNDNNAEIQRINVNHKFSHKLYIYRLTITLRNGTNFNLRGGLCNLPNHTTNIEDLKRAITAKFSSSWTERISIHGYGDLRTWINNTYRLWYPPLASITHTHIQTVDIYSAYDNNPEQVKVFEGIYNRTIYSPNYNIDRGYNAKPTTYSPTQAQRNQLAVAQDNINRYNNLKSQYDNLTRTHNNLVSSHNTYVTSSQRQIVDLSGQIDAKVNEVEQLSLDLALANEKLRKSTELLNKTQDKINDVASKMDDVVRKARLANDRLDNREYIKDIANYIKRNQDLSRDNMNLRNELDRLTQNNKAQTTEIENLKKEIEDAKHKEIISKENIGRTKNMRLVVNILIRYALMLVKSFDKEDIPLENNIYQLVIRLLKNKEDNASRYIDQVVETIDRVLEKSGVSETRLRKRYNDNSNNNFLKIIFALKMLVNQNTSGTPKKVTLAIIKKTLSSVSDLDAEDIERLMVYSDNYLDRHS